MSNHITKIIQIATEINSNLYFYQIWPGETFKELNATLKIKKKTDPTYPVFTKLTILSFEFFVFNPILSDLAILCKSGL